MFVCFPFKDGLGPDELMETAQGFGPVWVWEVSQTRWLLCHVQSAACQETKLAHPKGAGEKPIG